MEIRNEQIEDLRVKRNLAKSENLENLKVIEEQELRLAQLQTENLELNNQIFEIELNQQRKMAVELKDAILAIPSFSGDKKELDSFVNTCDLYVELIDNAHTANLLRIIKSKITGEALNRKFLQQWK